MSTTSGTWCHACGSPRAPGELLQAVWPNGQVATVCRYGVSPRCLAAVAGARITLLDPEAADAFDRLAAVPAGRS